MLPLRGSGVSIMGILNVTPDSFSGDGAYHDIAGAVERAAALLREGADIIDIGGESTRPGANTVPVEEELQRVLPVIRAVKEHLSVQISIDTSKPEVMEAAVSAGASMVNDVYALRRPGALEMAARLNVPVCLMHMQGTPPNMQKAPAYTDVVREVSHFLSSRVRASEAAGIARHHLMVDPGFGFGKTFQHNVQLLRGLGDLADVGIPIVVGVSRKAFVRRLASVDQVGNDETAQVSAGLALYAASQGAAVLRVHDVALTRNLVRTWETLASPPLNECNAQLQGSLC
ncbi:MAG TPA: dihydropteroate synthase [Gammaproteobacteria bacterium]|jgi:dihydropteroate synthase|nr:dihydropteroate synthase [Gammaproteobacteria bacterium]